jgi:MerR HTH family regulatory protein
VPISGETPAGRRRRLEASRRGSRTVSEAFDGAVTRRRYSELVGIHPKTLKRWEDEGVVAPKLETIMNSPTRVFTDRDVEFGRRLIAILRQEPGRYSLSEAARKAR